MLYPKYCFADIYEIPEDFFTQNKIKTILLDIDGTVVPHNFPKVSPRLWGWVDAKRESGIKVILISNNKEQRVKNFAELLDVPFFFDAKKPLQKIFKKVKAEEEGEFCIIGDQIFTDILGGNLAKMITILVNPIDDDEIKGVSKFRRNLEKSFRKVKKVKTKTEKNVSSDGVSEETKTNEDTVTEEDAKSADVVEESVTEEKVSEENMVKEQSVLENAPEEKVEDETEVAEESLTENLTSN